MGKFSVNKVLLEYRCPIALLTVHGRFYVQQQKSYGRDFMVYKAKVSALWLFAEFTSPALHQSLDGSDPQSQQGLSCSSPWSPGCRPTLCSRRHSSSQVTFQEAIWKHRYGDVKGICCLLWRIFSQRCHTTLTLRWLTLKWSHLAARELRSPPIPGDVAPAKWGLPAGKQWSESGMWFKVTIIILNTLWIMLPGIIR